MQLSHLDLKFNLNIKAVAQADSDYFTFEGYASTFGNVDYGSDVVVSGAFNASLKERMPKLLYQHDMHSPIGSIYEAFEDSKGLFIKARLPKNNTMAADVASLINCGALDAMSIGFVIKDFDMKENVRYIKRVELFEVSVVTFPMNDKALITDSKSVAGDTALPLADEDREWDEEAAVAKIRKFTDSTDEPTDKYKRFFMYYDGEKPKDFTAYKLPFADIIDGKAYAVPRAIFAIAAALKGARGGVKIDDEDKEAIKKKLKVYYGKMDKPDPFSGSDDEKSSGTPIFYKEDAEKITTKREFERCLRDSGMFSKQAVTVLASRFIEQSDSVNDDSDKDSKKALLVEIQKLVKKFK